MNLPREIRESQRAVVWRYTMRDGGRTKLPYQVRHPSMSARVNDPSTWGSFSEACAVVDRGWADGVGVVLGHGLCGGDLDHVRDVETGIINDAAMAIITELSSYTEISPSGEGVHVLMRGTLPPGGRRRGHLELYDGGRFFAITDQHVPGTPTTIEERTAVLAALHGRLFDSPTPRVMPPHTVRVDADDQQLIARAHAARNGGKFARLWAGSTAGYPSPSEADLALCGLLSFWTGGDEHRIDRLFRRSGLMRPKWDEKHGGITYGRRTISKAIKGGM